MLHSFSIKGAAWTVAAVVLSREIMEEDVVDICVAFNAGQLSVEVGIKS